VDVGGFLVELGGFLELAEVAVGADELGEDGLVVGGEAPGPQ
jgi:hypothetical protein